MTTIVRLLRIAAVGAAGAVVLWFILSMVKGAAQLATTSATATETER